MSYFSHLECSLCARRFQGDQVQNICMDCHAPLLARYDLETARQILDRDAFRWLPKGMWRWMALLPVVNERNIVSLGEGDTPLIPLERVGKELGLAHLYLKDESRNPTGTFKARGLSAAVSKANELGVERLIIPTAGNAGGALAAYAARARLEAAVIMPGETPAANILECRLAGTEVTLVEGLIHDAARLANRKAQEEGWYDVSTFKEPYRAEGKKVMGYELAEAFSWVLPDVIVYPTGGGTGLVGMWKAFNELAALGWLESPALPRMVAVQAQGCAPVVKAFEEQATDCDFWEAASTIAAGLRVPKSFAGQLILEGLYDSHGTAVTVSDEAIRAAQKRLASCEGIFPAPEGAATLAGLEQLVQDGWLQPEENIVLFNTGTGLKYL